jgi:hypothetical protein
MTDFVDYFEKDGVEAALWAFVDSCLDHLGGDEQDVILPDPSDYLEARGFGRPPDGSVEVHRAVSFSDVEPLRPICEDGSDGCLMKRKKINGKWVWVWVCRCP